MSNLKCALINKLLSANVDVMGAYPPQKAPSPLKLKYETL